MEFFDTEHNPEGHFENEFVAAGDTATLVDLKTSLMWQRQGLDIGSIRTIQRKISELNKEGYAGFSDWRLPTLEEAMSIMDQKKNKKGVLSFIRNRKPGPLGQVRDHWLCLIK